MLQDVVAASFGGIEGVRPLGSAAARSTTVRLTVMATKAELETVIVTVVMMVMVVMTIVTVMVVVMVMVLVMVVPWCRCDALLVPDALVAPQSDAARPLM